MAESPSDCVGDGNSADEVVHSSKNEESYSTKSTSHGRGRRPRHVGDANNITKVTLTSM